MFKDFNVSENRVIRFKRPFCDVNEALDICKRKLRDVKI